MHLPLQRGKGTSMGWLMSSHLQMTPQKGLSPSVPHRKGFNPLNIKISHPHQTAKSRPSFPALPRHCARWHDAQHNRIFSLKESECKQTQLCCRDSSSWEQGFPQLHKADTCTGQGVHLEKKTGWGAPKSGFSAAPGRPGWPQPWDIQHFYFNDNSMPAIKSWIERKRISLCVGHQHFLGHQKKKKFKIH